MDYSEKEKRCIANIMIQDQFDTKDTLIIKFFRYVQDQREKIDKLAIDLELIQRYARTDKEQQMFEALQASKDTIEHCKYFYNGPHVSELEYCLQMINSVIGGQANETL